MHPVHFSANLSAHDQRILLAEVEEEKARKNFEDCLDHEELRFFVQGEFTHFWTPPRNPFDDEDFGFTPDVPHYEGRSASTLKCHITTCKACQQRTKGSKGEKAFALERASYRRLYKKAA